jgi:hypothetical protein
MMHDDAERCGGGPAPSRTNVHWWCTYAAQRRQTLRGIHQPAADSKPPDDVEPSTNSCRYCTHRLNIYGSGFSTDRYSGANFVLIGPYQCNVIHHLTSDTVVSAASSRSSARRGAARTRMGAWQARGMHVAPCCWHRCGCSQPGACGRALCCWADAACVPPPCMPCALPGRIQGCSPVAGLMLAALLLPMHVPSQCINQPYALYTSVCIADIAAL